jgi:hypothetical protein
MDPSIVYLILLFGLVTAFFTWVYGHVQTARAQAVLASSALLITSLGAALLLAPGSVAFLDFLVGMSLEGLGTAGTLALCLIGLRRTTTGRGWKATLLVGGLAPLGGVALAGLFPATRSVLPQLLGSDILGLAPIFAGFAGAEIASLVAGCVTTAYAVSTAARERRPRVGAAVGRHSA